MQLSKFLMYMILLQNYASSVQKSYKCTTVKIFIKLDKAEVQHGKQKMFKRNGCQAYLSPKCLMAALILPRRFYGMASPLFLKYATKEYNPATHNFNVATVDFGYMFRHLQSNHHQDVYIYIYICFVFLYYTMTSSISSRC
jgi:hypothetical protein